MKLNHDKCMFALDDGKFLGFIVSQGGIEANPEKIKVIIDMQAPETIRDIQRLTGRLAALRRFISKLAERCLPFFDTLKGTFASRTITWREECKKPLKNSNDTLPPLLS